MNPHLIPYSGVKLGHLSLNEEFKKVHRPIYFVNDFDVANQADEERLSTLLFTHYSAETLDIQPKCLCEKTEGEHRLYEICKYCDQPVDYVTERPLESILWIRRPAGIEAFIAPSIYRKLDKHILKIKGKFSALQWLIDPHYTVKRAEVNDAVEAFLALQLPRGINAFHNHFDEIVDAILVDPTLKMEGMKRRSRKLLTGTLQHVKLSRRWIQEHRDKIFTHFLPIPSALAFVIERPGNGNLRYVDSKAFTTCIDAIRTIQSIEHSVFPLAIDDKESRVAKANRLMAEYFLGVYTSKLSQKEGLARSDIYGSRLDFTARAVITSVTGPHHDQDIHFPWALACELFKLVIHNKLLRRGYSINESQLMIEGAMGTWHPVIDAIFDEILKGQPSILFQRNPTLGKLSGQLLNIVKIYRDLNIRAIGLSDRILRFFNADFDGDQMNVILFRDKTSKEAFQRLAPKTGAFDINQPFKISEDIAISPPIASTMANWAHRHRNQ